MRADAPASGLHIWQPDRGFRYGAEAFWLVGFALEGGEATSVIDLGTGSGIAAMLLARKGVISRGIDLRAEWTPFWERTLADSAVAAALEVCDVRDATGRYDLAVSNPPFFPAGSGPASPDSWKAAARTESVATLADFRAAAERLAARSCFVVPREREGELLGDHRRWVRVGRRRSLIEVMPGAPVQASPDQLSEDAPRVRAWYDTATR